VSESKITMATLDQAIVASRIRCSISSRATTATTTSVSSPRRFTQVKKNRNIDAGKVWGFGYSKGAFMLNEFGCRKPGLFAAIAPHSGGAPQEQDNNGDVQCPNAQAITSSRRWA